MKGAVVCSPGEFRRMSEDAATLARLRVLWRTMHDYGSRFTTPDERLAAANELRVALD